VTGEVNAARATAEVKAAGPRGWQRHRGRAPGGVGNGGGGVLERGVRSKPLFPCRLSAAPS
jgi:hypothetical protein